MSLLSVLLLGSWESLGVYFGRSTMVWALEGSWWIDEARAVGWWMLLVTDWERFLFFCILFLYFGRSFLDSFLLLSVCDQLALSLVYVGL
jgi:hypothetical protein